MKTLNSIPNRTYKATIFAMLFEDKEHLLELYNAISGKHYTNPEMLEINTLENAIYMAMRNDISFLIDVDYRYMSISLHTVLICPFDFCFIFPHYIRL